MKWLMVVSSLDAADGGPPAAVLGLAIGLRRLGQQVTVVTHHHRGRDLHDAVDKAQHAGVRIRWVERHKVTRFQFSPGLLKAAQEESSRADSITCHGFYQWTCLVGYLVAVGSRRPLLLQPHGVFEPFQEQNSPAVKKAFRVLIGNWILKRVSAIVAASESEGTGFEETLGRHSPPILLAGLGVDVDHAQQTHRFDSRGVLFLSRVAPKKRLDKLFDAAEILAEQGRPIAVTVCGDGDPAYVESLKASLPAAAGVEWRGHVVDPERRDIEAAQALLCLPSDNENFGQAVTEAMARGLPVVTTRSTGASTHVLQADAGFVLDNPSPQELAEALDVALSDAAGLDRMSRRGVEYAEKNLTWEAVAARWLDFAERERE